MNITLKINPEFEDVIPPISSDEFEQLESNIVSEDMLLSPIITFHDSAFTANIVMYCIHEYNRIVSYNQPLGFTSG